MRMKKLAKISTQFKEVCLLSTSTTLLVLIYIVYLDAAQPLDSETMTNTGADPDTEKGVCQPAITIKEILLLLLIPIIKCKNISTLNIASFQVYKCLLSSR